jgi:hypothetical protein
MQKPPVVAEQSAPPFSVEVEASVFKRLRAIATKEGISFNRLGSELIKNVLLLHRSELNRIIDQIKRNHKCNDTS